VLLEQVVGLLQLARALADPLLEVLLGLAQLLDQQLAFALEPDLLGGIAQDLEQLLGPAGLHQVVVDVAQVDGVDGIVQLREAGHEQAHDLRAVLAHPFEKLNPGPPGHALVGEDDIEGAVFENGLRGIGRAGGQDLEVPADQGGQRGQNIRLVVNDEDRAFGRAH
jgi:hypothetical protein